MKKKLLIIIPIVVVVLAIIGLGVFLLLNSKKGNSLTSDAELADVKISNVSLVYENNTTMYRAKVTAKKDITVNHILINVTDKDKKTVELVGYVAKDLKKGETVDIVSAIDIDITGYKKIKYEVK